MKTISEELGFSEIKTRDLPVWMEVFKGESPEVVLKELHLIDRLLIIQKTHTLLGRKKGLKKQLAGMIDNYLGHEMEDLNRK
jgi:hypothetical protein